MSKLLVNNVIRKWVRGGVSGGGVGNKKGTKDEEVNLTFHVVSRGLIEISTSPRESFVFCLTYPAHLCLCALLIVNKLENVTETRQPLPHRPRTTR